MRFFLPLSLAFYAAFAFAQNNAINVPAGQSTLQVTAGQSTTITWTNPSSGTVTIKLQSVDGITPASGLVLASDIPASSKTASFTVPASVPASAVVIEIIDDTNQNNYNFSPQFSVQGATGTATALGPTSTGSATASSASGSSTGSITSVSASSASSASSGSSASSTSSKSSASSESASTSSGSSTSSATATQTTSAPSGNAAIPLKVQGGLLALAMGAAALV